MNLVDRLFRKLRGESASAVGDTLASLVLAAREDEAFRQRVMFILKLPAKQRDPLVRSAVEEMKFRGEPAAIQAAFLTLATDRGAALARQLIKGE